MANCCGARTGLKMATVYSPWLRYDVLNARLEPNAVTGGHQSCPTPRKYQRPTSNSLIEEVRVALENVTIMPFGAKSGKLEDGFGVRQDWIWDGQRHVQQILDRCRDGLPMP